MKLYVGNLSFDTNEDTLRNTFAEHGEVEEVAVITDRDTGRPRGFAFVTMRDDNAARNAMQALDVTLLRSPGVAQWWHVMRPLIAPDYAEHLDGLLKKYDGPALTELLPWCEPDDSGTEA